MSTVKMEKALKNLQSNPYFEKYSARISELQKTSPEKFKSLVQQQTKEEISTKIAPVDTRLCSPLQLHHVVLMCQTTVYHSRSCNLLT